MKFDGPQFWADHQVCPLGRWLDGLERTASAPKDYSERLQATKKLALDARDKRARLDLYFERNDR